MSYEPKLLYGLTAKQMYEVYNEYEKYLVMNDIERHLAREFENIGIVEPTAAVSTVDLTKVYCFYDVQNKDNLYEEQDKLAERAVRDYMFDMTEELLGLKEKKE